MSAELRFLLGILTMVAVTVTATMSGQWLFVIGLWGTFAVVAIFAILNITDRRMMYVLSLLLSQTVAIFVFPRVAMYVVGSWACIVILFMVLWGVRRPDIDAR